MSRRLPSRFTADFWLDPVTPSGGTLRAHRCRSCLCLECGRLMVRGMTPDELRERSCAGSLLSPAPVPAGEREP